MIAQGLELEHLVDQGFRPMITTNLGSNMKTDHKAYELYFKPSMVNTFGYELADINVEGKPTFFSNEIPVGVSFKTATGKVLFERLAPQGGCRWCLHPTAHANIRAKGGEKTPPCPYSKFCRACGVQFSTLEHNKRGENHNCTAGDPAFFDPPRAVRADSTVPIPKGGPAIVLSDQAAMRALIKKRKLDQVKAQKVTELNHNALVKKARHEARMAEQQHQAAMRKKALAEQARKDNDKKNEAAAADFAAQATTPYNPAANGFDEDVPEDL
jgi:hypothetical protein